MNRYQRQIVLPELGLAGQQQLSRSSVLCIGAGGLGVPVLQYLAAAGVGRIGIVDDDIIDISNLQRQVLYTEADSGKNKAQTAADHLRKLNSEIELQIFSTRLHAENIENIFAGYDVIVDCTDNFAAKYLINDAGYKLNKPVIAASVLGWAGQVTVLHPPQSPCYRCLFHGESQTHAPNCAEAGVIGALTGMIGSMQAVEAIKLCLGTDFCRTHNLIPLLGNLLLVDARDFTIKKLLFPKNPACPLCSKARDKVMLADTDFVCAAPADAVFIDVREQAEWDKGHVDGAIHLPLTLITQSSEWVERFPKQKPYILYCQQGRRSKQALEIFQKQGFAAICDLPGGYANFKNKG